MTQRTRPTGSARLSPIVELRQYDLVPGTRDTLIEIFDRQLIEGQEAEGMVVIGQFRDLDNPDSFVWLRGFADMETRRKALDGFYSGPAWLANRDAANATMLRFDNVLLLRPATADGGFALDIKDRPAAGADDRTGGLVAATIWPVRRGAEDEAARLFDRTLKSRLADSGGRLLGTLRTNDAENTYPQLPVRGDANVVVWFAAFPDAAAHAGFAAALERSSSWREAWSGFSRHLDGAPVIFRLQPTARSLLG